MHSMCAPQPLSWSDWRAVTSKVTSKLTSKLTFTFTLFLSFVQHFDAQFFNLSFFWGQSIAVYHWSYIGGSYLY